MPAFLDDSPRSLILVSAAFWPASEAGVARISSFVRYLPELGFLPAVVTTDGAALPEGCDDRIALHRVKYRDPRPGGVPYSADRLPLWRRLARDVLALPDRYRRWSRRAASVAWALARERHAPVLVSVPPLSAAWHLARSRRSGDPPLFIDFRDGWMVDPVRADYYRNPIRRAIEARMERTTLAAAAAIFAASPRLAASFRDRAPHLAKRCYLLLNGFDDRDWEALPDPPELRRDVLNIVYAGSFPGYRTPEHVLEAIAGLDGVPVHLHVLGDYTGKTKYLLASRFPELRDRVSVVDRIARSACLAWQGAADLLLLVVTPGPHGDESDGEMTSKCFEYLRAGRRILATVPPGGDADQLLAKFPWVVRPASRDVEGIRGALVESARRKTEQPALDDVLSLIEPLRRDRQIASMAERIGEHLAPLEGGVVPNA